MLINEVDAIPQRNCLNLSDLKKRRGSTQANTATKLYTLDAFRGKKLSTHNKTRKTVAATGSNGREEETKEAR